MDAVKFLKEIRRMCKSYERCEDCEINKLKIGQEKCTCAISMNQKEAVSIVEKWSAEHPAKTRQSEFLRVLPFAPTDDNGVPIMMPCHVDYRAKKRCNSYTDCGTCKKEYWAVEVE